MQVQQNVALFSLLSNVFGGTAPTTFALPDLRGRVPVGFGNYVPPANVTDSPATYHVGDAGGTETVTLATTSMPQHTHTVVADASNGVVPVGSGNYFSQAVISATNTTAESLYAPPANLVPLNASTVTGAGGDASHSNMEPYLVLAYWICTQGYYPSRND
jgi:microcystin-dependent protein